MAILFIEDEIFQNKDRWGESKEKWKYQTRRRHGRW